MQEAYEMAVDALASVIERVFLNSLAYTIPLISNI